MNNSLIRVDKVSGDRPVEASPEERLACICAALYKEGILFESNDRESSYEILLKGF